ncbi:mitochondrial ribosomal subunit protein-domain-containing protein [Xylaria venustula]|nr:mitochondrial ribosomal subunit protein-domain-containing protein [Xylaria venustula]
MASAMQSMRLCLRAASRRAAIRTTAAPPRHHLAIRTFSATPFKRQPAAKKDEEEDEEEDEEQKPSEGELSELEQGIKDGIYESLDFAETERLLKKYLNLTDVEYDDHMDRVERTVTEIGSAFTEEMRPPRLLQKAFWADEEPDNDLLVEEDDKDEFDEDDIMSLAHAKFEEYREYREYARIAAWQMPLLSKLATPFEAPTAKEPLRFRYTSYMGEFHPAEKKVVVEFSPRDMPLNEAQQQKLRKLLGVRWNPETDIAKMSCEQFEHPAQNKRYLGDLVNKLVAQAKDPIDMFEDVPLDTRHHAIKVKPKFPKEWRMTEERRKVIEDTRQQMLLLDQKKEESGTLVDGVEKIDAFFNPPKPARDHLLPEMAHARLGSTLSAPPRRHQFPARH